MMMMTKMIIELGKSITQVYYIIYVNQYIVGGFLMEGEGEISYLGIFLSLFFFKFEGKEDVSSRQSLNLEIFF